MDLAGLPKIELHLHLDCSLSFEEVKRLDPAISFEEYRNSFVAPVNCLDLSEYIKRAIPAIQLMQSEEALEAVTLDLFEQLARDSILYAEIRFAPLEHTREGLSVEEVVRSVERAVQRGIRETGIEVRVILCTLRHYNARQSLQTVELVEQFRTGLVVGFDIAADEAGYPIDAHLAAFQYAQRHGIPCTAHAGEACGADSVWETLEHFHPQRIGHGVRSVEDPALVEHLARRQIHLEVCPTSNLQTKVFRQMCDHSIGRLYAAGVPLSINTDGRTISDVDLTREYGKLVEVFGWTAAEFLRCNLYALEAAFLSEAEKRPLREKLLSGFKQPS